MVKDKIIIGSHVSLTSPEYYLGSVKEALSYKANTLMIYTGAPRNSFRLPLEKFRLEEAFALIKEHHLDESKFIIHAPYILNLADNTKEDKYAFAISYLKDEVVRAEKMHIPTIVLHPGSHLGLGEKVGINNLCLALNEILADDKKVKIAIESMAGKGNEIGKNLEELKMIYDGVIKKERLGFCLDTCHLSDAGYNLENIDDFLQKVEETIGIKNILVLHINDSKNPSSSHKDRHENIGYGFLGFETLLKFIYHPLLIDVPKILETPYFANKPPYLMEIANFKKKEFHPFKD